MNKVLVDTATLQASANPSHNKQQSKKTRSHRQQRHARRASTSSTGSFPTSGNDQRCGQVKKKTRNRRKMGICTSKKKHKENKEHVSAEDVWKKREDEPPTYNDAIEKIAKEKKEDPLITELKSVLPNKTFVANPNFSNNSSSLGQEFPPSPQRRRKPEGNIKHADDSSSSSQGYLTPLSTPPTSLKRRVQHPVFKVATPPPSRRIVETENKISSPIIERVRKQSDVVPPSPPPRKNDSMQQNEITIQPSQVFSNQAAPNLPPRRHRLVNKLESPSLSRKTDHVNVEDNKDDTSRDLLLTCDKCNSPLVSRKYDRAPTPPPRKGQSQNNQDASNTPRQRRGVAQNNSAQVGSPPSRRAYPVFKVDTPPPSRRVIENNIKNNHTSSIKNKNEKVEMTNTVKKECSTKGDEKNEWLPTKMDVPKDSEINEKLENRQPLLSDSKPIYSSISKQRGVNLEQNDNLVKMRKKQEEASTYPSLVIKDDSRYLVRKEKTLSMEVEEENLRNYLRENATKLETPATMNILPGPILVKESTLPSPVRAVISNVPPPSPNSMNALVEEEEVDEGNDENLNQDRDRQSKDMDEFNDMICQRLSLLLESSENIIGQGSEFEESGDEQMNEKSRDNLVGIQKKEYIVNENEGEIEERNICKMEDTVPPPPEYFDDYSLDLMNNNQCAPSGRIGKSGVNDGGRSDFAVDNKNAQSKTFNYKDYCQGIKHTSKDIQDKIDLINESGSSCREDPDGRSDNPVIEECIVPISIKRRSYEPFIDKRHSDLLSDVIQSYTKPGECDDVKCIMEEPIVSKGEVHLESKKKSSSLERKPSKLDQSLKKLFTAGPVEEDDDEDDTYSKLLPLESFLDDVVDQPLQAEKSLPFDPFDLNERLRSRRVLGGRQSVTRTESDIDISEPGDVGSSESAEADDEDELDLIEGGEVIFSRTYPDTRQGGNIRYSGTLQCGTFHDNDYDDDDDELSDDEYDDYEEDNHNLWEDKREIEERDSEPVEFGANYYPLQVPFDAGDIAFDSARRQMHEIHSHLANLRSQMEYLADECEGANLKPSRCSGVSVGKRCSKPE